jgi:hypothetical protein
MERRRPGGSGQEPLVTADSFGIACRACRSSESIAKRALFEPPEGIASFIEKVTDLTGMQPNIDVALARPGCAPSGIGDGAGRTLQHGPGRLSRWRSPRLGGPCLLRRQHPATRPATELGHRAKLYVAGLNRGPRTAPACGRRCRGQCESVDRTEPRCCGALTIGKCRAQADGRCWTWARPVWPFQMPTACDARPAP